MDRGESVKSSGSEGQVGQVEPTTHSVFLIQNILKDILHFVEYKDLVKCRGVCPLWNFTAAPILQKQRTLFFRDYVTFNGYHPSRKLLALRPLQTRAVPRLQNPQTFRPKGLGELTELLKNSKRLNLAHCFPYRKFQFIDQLFQYSMKNLNDGVLQRFLDIFGRYIDELSIAFDPRPAIRHKNSVYISNILHESVVMRLIENLLVNQAPSLSFLSLGILTHVTWELDGESRGAMSRLRTTDPEFKHIQQSVKMQIDKFRGQSSFRGMKISRNDITSFSKQNHVHNEYIHLGWI